jgi:hypothetical protein
MNMRMVPITYQTIFQLPPSLKLNESLGSKCPLA